MINEDRRKERRKSFSAPEAPLLRWYGASGEYDASISDVSASGCFLHTTGKAEVGEIVRFDKSLPDGRIVELRGTVIHHEKRLVGFGLRFQDLSPDQEALIEFLASEIG